MQESRCDRPGQFQRTNEAPRARGKPHQLPHQAKACSCARSLSRSVDNQPAKEGLGYFIVKRHRQRVAPGRVRLVQVSHGVGEAPYLRPPLPNDVDELAGDLEDDPLAKRRRQPVAGRFGEPSGTKPD